MSEVVSISEAKANLSKLVKRAQAGETILLGAYGNVQAVLGPAPARRPIAIGIWAHKRIADAYDLDDLVEPDLEVAAEFDASVVARGQHDDSGA